MGDSFHAFIHRILEDLISERGPGVTPCSGTPVDSATTFAGYTRVVVQDSTIIRLPTHLFEEFSGVSNSHSKVCNARVQATYDLLALRLVNFSIDSYSKNGKLDIPVLLNNEARTPVRLVSAPVSEETANLRRMKARKCSNSSVSSPRARRTYCVPWLP